MSGAALVLAVIAALAVVGSGEDAVGLCEPAEVGETLITGAPFTPEQAENASTIVEVVRSVMTERGGFDDAQIERAQVISIAVATVESRLVNLRTGDRDSLGMFQQRPSHGWGTPEQILDRGYATTSFAEALLALDDWDSMPPSEAAQLVQRSAWAHRYTSVLDDAGRIVAASAPGPAPVCDPAPRPVPQPITTDVLVSGAAATGDIDTSDPREVATAVGCGWFEEHLGQHSRTLAERLASLATDDLTSSLAEIRVPAYDGNPVRVEARGATVEDPDAAPTTWTVQCRRHASADGAHEVTDVSAIVTVAETNASAGTSTWQVTGLTVGSLTLP